MAESQVGMSSVKTTVFIVGGTPYKDTILLPKAETRIPVSVVQQAIVDQHDKPLPSLPRRYFFVLNYLDGDQHQVAMFRYEKVAGCRSTDSPLHGQLPVPSRRHRDIAGFTCEPQLRVGFQYLYGYFHEYNSGALRPAAPVKMP